jgi:hypothetical protein
MELMVATWTLRVAALAALAVGYVSYQANASMVDCVDRAMAVAVGFTFAGRWLAGFLEPPEVKMLRMRKKREAKRAKSRKSGSSQQAAARRQSASTISRTA